MDLSFSMEHLGVRYYCQFVEELERKYQDMEENIEVSPSQRTFIRNECI